MRILVLAETARPDGLGGDSRRLLDSIIRQAGHDPAECVHVGIPATSRVKEVRAAHDGLMARVAELRPDKILTLGNTPLAVLQSRKAAITNEHGLLEWVDYAGGRALLTGTISPANCLKPIPANHAGAYNPRDWVRTLRQDVVKLLSRDAPMPQPDASYMEPETQRDLELALAEFAPYDLVSCDVETEPEAAALESLRLAKSPTAWREEWPHAGLTAVRDRILSLGVGTRDGPALIVNRRMLAEAETSDKLWPFLWGGARSVAFHNAKFDLQFIAMHLGAHAPIGARVEDTQLMSWLLDERPIRSMYKVHGLKDLARTRYDVPDYHFDFPAFWKTPEAERDYDAYHRYHTMDLRLTARLFWDLDELIATDPGLDNAYRTLLIPGTLALAEAELRGIPVDRAYLQDRLEWYDRRLDRRLRMIRSATNDPEFNPASSAQVVDLLFGDEDSGGFGWEPIAFAGYKVAVTLEAKANARKEQVGKLADIHGGREATIARSIVAWKRDSKARNSYVKALLDSSRHDGRVRAQFNLGGAATGRLSSEKPSMHQIPKRGTQATTVRKGFAASPGWLLMESDYSQLELRIAALLSRDDKLSAAYRENRDLHKDVASVMFRKPVESLSYMERYLAKAVDFGAIYGRSGRAISMGAEMDFYETQLGGVKWTPEEAQAFVDRFLNGYPQLKAWLDNQGVVGVRDQELTTIFGRKRRFPLVLPQDRSQVRRQSFNTPIQSVASDICLSAFARLAMRLDPDEARVLFPVHDAIILEVREDRLLETARVVKWEMQENLPPEVVAANRGLDIPMTVDVKAGVNLSDEAMHEVEGL